MMRYEDLVFIGKMLASLFVFTAGCVMLINLHAQDRSFDVYDVISVDGDALRRDGEWRLLQTITYDEKLRIVGVHYIDTKTGELLSSECFTPINVARGDSIQYNHHLVMPNA